MVVAVLTNGCRRFDLCLVAVLTTIVAVLVIAVLACRRFGCRRFGSVAVLVVAVSTCRRSDLYPSINPGSVTWCHNFSRAKPKGRENQIDRGAKAKITRCVIVALLFICKIPKVTRVVMLILADIPEAIMKPRGQAFMFKNKVDTYLRRAGYESRRSRPTSISARRSRPTSISAHLFSC